MAESRAVRTRRTGQGRQTPVTASLEPSELSSAAGAGRAGSDRASARSEQFLDVAADLVRSRGLGGVTMERLADAAGVSKALPYRYFDNADAVFVALYEREMGSLVDRITAAVLGRRPDEDAIAVAVHEYFDVVSERGELLASLTGPGSPIPDLVDRAHTGPNLLAQLLTDVYGVKGVRALVLASILIAAIVGASDSVARGEASRSTAEKVAVTALTAAVRAVAAS